MISENLALVKNRIAEAARRSGRPPESVRLVAVSKGAPADRIKLARSAGAELFGENKVQEARDKIAQLGREDFSWHFIGHLQKNKVKYVFDLFDMIHSVDSLALAGALHAEALKRGTVMPILLQVNVSGEESKFGAAPGELEDLLSGVSRLSGVRVRGLMTIPPYRPDPEASRRHFARLREVRDRLAGLHIENVSLDELSMGMSNDFEIAVEEGATLARVGTAIFGERQETALP
ncbi:MAG: YggS family pyridoxal phosphate-dependent enzyme [Nitrospinae bacterium]|nr:YggS family pyridoxal phosphate-dependent enzyme [Nitrospinota bacterium]